MRVDGWTLLLQAINFLILVWLLRRFLYRPVLAVIAERQAATDGVRAKAEGLRQEAETLRRGLEEERAALARQGDRALSDARAEAEAGRAALLEKARAEADAAAAAARAALDEERGKALAGLQDRAAGLATVLAGRLLRAASGGGVDAPLLDAACRSVEALPGPQRRALAGEDGSPVPVRLVAAGPLDGEACAARLSRALGRPVALTVERDPGLLAGVELHFPHSVLRHSWKQALAEAREELTRDDDPRRGA